MSRKLFYAHNGEFLPNEMPELEAVSLKELEDEGTLNIEAEEQAEDFYLPPEEDLNFE